MSPQHFFPLRTNRRIDLLFHHGLPLYTLSNTKKNPGLYPGFFIQFTVCPIESHLCHEDANIIRVSD